jgi:hypothetical protein
MILALDRLPALAWPSRLSRRLQLLCILFGSERTMHIDGVELDVYRFALLEGQ